MKLDGECMMCALERKTELGEAERYLGASVMEPDVRVKVNDRGFCRKHHAMLFSMSNRLGHALMLESHMIENREKLAKISDKLEKSAAMLKNAGIGDKLSGKTKTATDEILKQAQAVNGIQLIEACEAGQEIDPTLMRNAALTLQKELKNSALIGAFASEGKPQLVLMYSDDLVAAGRNAGKDIRDAAKFIQGGGGGQPGLATAGGKNAEGLREALAALREIATRK